MNKQGYVSLGVALCAALGVHAFVFFYTAPFTTNLVDVKPIQISLLPQPVPAQEQSLEEENPQKRNTPIKTPEVVKHEIVKVKVLMGSAAQSVKVPMPTSMPVQQKSEAAQALPQVIPKSIQQSILAAIVYPRRAMRRGWEGSAKFSLDIQQQMIRHVTLLVSTGYKALDNAAQKGIATIDSLPLSDGQHILPVSFHLQ